MSRIKKNDAGNDFCSLYWRPQKASRPVLAMIAFASLIGLVVVQRSGSTDLDRNVERLAAAKLAEQFMQAIKAKREEIGLESDKRFDEHATGMIGSADSNVTSKVANLSAKQVSVHPDFAAAIVEMLRDAGVDKGDTIAVGWTGSFPAFNACLCAAIETMDLRPVVIASAMSSQYGANDEEFLWVDMEKHLADSSLIRFRSSAMTQGGAADHAFRFGDDVTQAIENAQRRVGIPWLGATRLAHSIDNRMALYTAEADAKPIAAYVNVGGGIASMGGKQSTGILAAGVNNGTLSSEMPDCVASRFAKKHVPVIHLAHARELGERFSINIDKAVAHVAGESDLYRSVRPSRLSAGLSLLVITGLLYAFVLRDHGYRILDAIAVQLRWRPEPKIRVVADTEHAISQLMV